MIVDTNVQKITAAKGWPGTFQYLNITQNVNTNTVKYISLRLITF
jgi:hypothetical protein